MIYQRWKEEKERMRSTALEHVTTMYRKLYRQSLRSVACASDPRLLLEAEESIACDLQRTSVRDEIMTGRKAYPRAYRAYADLTTGIHGSDRLRRARGVCVRTQSSDADDLDTFCR